MKILVVGCGSIGRRHAANASLMAQVGVTDTSQHLAEQAAQSCRATLFPSLEEALAWKPDGVVVAVPHAAHLAVALAAARAGADVLVEKPLSHSMEGVEAFLDQMDALERKAWVVCNMRFHPAVDALRRNLERVGRPLFARAHVGNLLSAMRPGADYRELYCAKRSSGGGVILDAIHELDYLAWLFGPITDVRCLAARLGDMDIDVEDFASLALRFQSGAAAQVQMDYLRPFKRRGCEIVGTGGILLWESEGKAPEACQVRLYDAQAGSWEDILNLPSVDANAPYAELMRDFITGLEGGTSGLLEARQAAEALAVALEALRQGLEGWEQ